MTVAKPSMLSGIVHGLVGAAAIVGSIVTWELGRKSLTSPPAPVIVAKPAEPTVKSEPPAAKTTATIDWDALVKAAMKDLASK